MLFVFFFSFLFLFFACSHRVRHFLQRLLLARAASPSIYRRTLARSAGRSSVAPTTTVSPLVVRSRLAPISGLLKLNETIRARGATNRDVRVAGARVRGYESLPEASPCNPTCTILL